MLRKPQEVFVGGSDLCLFYRFFTSCAFLFINGSVRKEGGWSVCDGYPINACFKCGPLVTCGSSNITTLSLAFF